MKIEAIQHQFQTYLKNEALEIENEIVEDAKLTVQERLAIYFNAYRWRLYEILESDYPKLLVLMGQESFDSLSKEYLDLNPSHYFSVRYFGQNLSTFLQNTKPYSDYPYLQEMAQFEWAMSNTLDAKDATLLTIDTMKSLPLDRFAELQIRLHPSVQLLYFTWDTPELWQAIDENTEERSPKRLLSPAPWLIFRSELSCAFRSMNQDEAFALQTIQSSKCIETLCEALCERMPEENVPMFTLQCLEQWLRDGIVSEII